MKYLKLFENLENPSIFIKHIVSTYLESMYGFYDYEFRKNKIDAYTFKVMFVEFDNSSANGLNKLSEYLSYNWSLDIRGMHLEDPPIMLQEKFYMVALFEIEGEAINGFVEDIKFNNTTDKYNL